MIPQRGPGQSFDSHQVEVAFWLGCDVQAMNDAHDSLHRALCAWLGVTSQAMRDAVGEVLTAHERNLAMRGVRLPPLAAPHGRRWRWSAEWLK